MPNPPEHQCPNEILDLLGQTVKGVRSAFNGQREIAPFIKQLETQLKQYGYSFGPLPFALEIRAPLAPENDFRVIAIPMTFSHPTRYRVAVPPVCDANKNIISPAWLIPLDREITDQEKLAFDLAFDIR